MLIMESQLKHLLGLSIPSGTSFVGTLEAIRDNFYDTNPVAVGVGIFTLVLAVMSKRLFPKLPNLLVALVGGSLVAYGLGLILGHDILGLKMVGEVPGRLPQPSLPNLGFDTIVQLSQSAFAIALLGLIEAVAIARSIGTKSQQQIDGNQEFIGQGLSNIVGSFFSCYAGSGSFTRSGINYEAGARTPLAAVFAAAMLLLIVLLVAPLIAYLPVAAMAGVIMVVGYNLIDFHFARTVARSSKRQTIVMVITFVATLIADLENAVFIGVIFSLIFYLQRTSTPNVAVMSPDPTDPHRKFTYLERKALSECPQMKMLRFDGSIFFGSVAHLSAEIRRLVDDEYPDVTTILVVARGINFIDVAGSEWVVNEAKRWKEKGGGLYFAGLKLNAQDTLIRGGFRAQMGEDHFFESKEDAIKNLVPMLNPNVCANCVFRIYRECELMPKPSDGILSEAVHQN